MAAELLDDKKIANAKAASKPYTLRDGKGLFVLVHPNGSKYFQVRATVLDKPKLIQLGSYGILTLAEARDKAREIKRLVAKGLDPVVEKKKAKAALVLASESTFHKVAEEWISEKAISAAYHKKISATLKANIFPRIGPMPVADITPPMLKECLKVMEARGTVELTKKTRAWLKEIFDFATEKGLRSGDNPAAVVRVRSVKEKENYPSFRSMEDLGKFFRRLNEYGGRIETVLGLAVLARTAARPGMLRLGEWSELDINDGIWTISKERMKMRRPHTVMLSSQTIELFKELHKLTGYQNLLLPDLIGTRPISNATFNQAIKRIWPEYPVVPHGFRHLFSTHANESRLFDKDIIEMALAHGDEDKIRSTYNQAEYRHERLRLAQWWSDEIDRFAKGADVLQIKVA